MAAISGESAAKALAAAAWRRLRRHGVWQRISWRKKIIWRKRMAAIINKLAASVSAMAWQIFASGEKAVMA